MDTKHLTDVERTTLVLSALVIGLALVFLGRHEAFSVVLGAGLTSLNAVALRWLAQRASKIPAERRTGLGLLLFNVKMAALIAMVYVAIRVIHVSPMWFVVGLSIFPVAIFVAGVRAAMRPAPHDDGAPPPDSLHDPMSDSNG